MTTKSIGTITVVLVVVRLIPIDLMLIRAKDSNLTLSLLLWTVPHQLWLKQVTFLSLILCLVVWTLSCLLDKVVRSSNAIIFEKVLESIKFYRCRNIDFWSVWYFIPSPSDISETLLFFVKLNRVKISARASDRLQLCLLAKDYCSFTVRSFHSFFSRINGFCVTVRQL